MDSLCCFSNSQVSFGLLEDFFLGGFVGIIYVV